jgi:Ca2+/Na+ antiporter
MDIAFPVMLFLLAFIFFLLGLMEERETKQNEDEEEKSDHLVVLFLAVAFILFFLAGICMLGITETYYSVVTDTLVEHTMLMYRPFVWLGVGLAFVDAFFLIPKVFEVLGKSGRT